MGNEMSMSDLRSQQNLPATVDTGRNAVAGGALGVEGERAVAQVQAAMVIAKRFPRDPQQSMSRIVSQCNIPQLAEEAEYVYKRGGQTVRGPSIRLLEVLAREWGNIEFSVVELHRGDGESLAMTYAWDLETNTRATRQFVVPHRRDKSEGATELKSDRDIYEMVANMGSRRVRACLEQIIPSHVKEAAIEACAKTKENVSKQKPLGERIAALVQTFASIGVSEPMISKWLKRPVGEMLEKDYQDLRAIGKTIRDGAGRIEDYFEKLTVSESVSAGKQAPAAAKQAEPPKEKPAEAAKPKAEAKPEAAKPAAQEPPKAEQAPETQAVDNWVETEAPTPASPATTTFEEYREMLSDMQSIADLNAMGKRIQTDKNLTAEQVKELKKVTGERAKALQAGAE